MRSNTIALLALFVALGGTGYAASGGFTSNGKLQACIGEKGTIRLLKPGKKCKEGQTRIAWNQAGPKGPQGVPGASGVAGANGVSVPNATNATNATTATTATNATNAINATNATNATNAQTAGNALALGGAPASEFTHRDCASLTGQIKGFVQLPEGFTTETFTNVNGYNCSGQPVEAESVAPGIHIIKFLGNGAAIAMATASAEAGVFSNYASVHRLAAGEWEVGTFNLNGEPINSGVELLVP